MATPSVITKLVPNVQDVLLGVTPYILEIKGQSEPRVAVKELMDIDTGRKTVQITAMAPEGAPVLPLPTLDQIARNILPNARIRDFRKGSRVMVREYAV